MTAVTLKYDMRVAEDVGVKGHPQTEMKIMGVTYRDCEAVSIADCWIFYGCENIPPILPGYLRAMP